MDYMDDEKYILGLDIGNGYGYASVVQNPNTDPIPLLPASLANLGMSTVAYVEAPSGEHIEVFSNGREAKRKFARTPQQLVHAVKTRLKEGTIAVPQVTEPVEVNRIYAAIVRDLLTLAEAELANKGIPRIYDVVFTFPASIADDVVMLDAMQKSIEQVVIDEKPIRVLGRIPEPAAVALDYLHYMQHVAPEQIRIKKKDFTVLVYDLGHGTFDTAVVTAQSEGTPYKLHLKDGLEQVGGKDFDELLFREILSLLQKKYQFSPSNERQREEIRQEAVKAKIALSDTESYTATILNQEGEYYQVELTRERFEKLGQYLVYQTLEMVWKMLDQANADGLSIDAVVLAGGASKIPMIRENLEVLLEKKCPVVMHRPSEAVAYGAALFAYGIAQQEKKLEQKAEALGEKKAVIQTANPVLEQLTDCCYGIWYPSEEKLEGEIKFLIKNGQPRPCSAAPVPFVSQSSRVVFRIYKSRKKNQELEKADMQECDSVLWIPFEVKKGLKYRLILTALENYGLQAELRSDEGDYYKKTTADTWEVLTGK